jgi:moderate conductance mechanosensitive channel
VLIRLVQAVQKADTAARRTAAPVLDIDWRRFFDLQEAANIGRRVLAVVVLAWISYRVLVLILQRIERSVADSDPTTISAHEQRVWTIIGLVRSVGIVFIGVIALFMILQAVGVNIGPLLAGAGVVGLAISFGAQSLVKDVISGLFILLENQFGVGDVIRIGDMSGRVEKITLRIVTMRDHQGIVHIVPNGEIKQVSNLTRAFSRAVLDIDVAYKEDVDRVMEVMRDVGRGLWEDPEWRPLLSEEITVPGVEAFADSAVRIRMVATTVPLKQWDVARELRRRLKRRFDDEGIEIPYPHHPVHWGEGQAPLRGDSRQRSQSSGRGGE